MIFRLLSFKNRLLDHNPIDFLMYKVRATAQHRALVQLVHIIIHCASFDLNEFVFLLRKVFIDTSTNYKQTLEKKVHPTFYTIFDGR